MAQVLFFYILFEKDSHLNALEFPLVITVGNMFPPLITVGNTFPLVITVGNTFPLVIIVGNTFPLVITVRNMFPLVITVENMFPLLITVGNTFTPVITVGKNNGSSFFLKNRGTSEMSSTGHRMFENIPSFFVWCLKLKINEF